MLYRSRIIGKVVICGNLEDRKLWIIFGRYIIMDNKIWKVEI